MHRNDVERQRPHARDMRVEGDVFPEILVVPKHDRQAAPEHEQRIFHCDPMIGIDLGIVGVAMMGKVHVAERLILVQQDRAAHIADEMVEPQPPRISAGNVAMAGFVQRRLVGV